MLETIAITLPFLVAAGLVTARTRRASARCRRYLAIIERWQPRVLGLPGEFTGPALASSNQAPR